MLRAPDIASAAPLARRIEEAGARLRPPLQALVESLAGEPARPKGLMRAVGLDKTLAGRLIRAVGTRSNLEFVHCAPSPAGFRILIDRAAGEAPDELLEEMRRATEEYDRFLASTPGGRDAIEAMIAESSAAVQERAVHTAKRSSFKSMSYLLGHYCEALASSIFIVPSSEEGFVDAVEVCCRVGMHRLRPSRTLSVFGVVNGQSSGPRIESIVGTDDVTDFVVASQSTDPSLLTVVREESMTMLVLKGDPGAVAPSRLSTALRIRRLRSMELAPGPNNVRGYVLTIPSRVLVRDLFIAQGLFPEVVPSVQFVQSTPGGFTNQRPVGPCPDYLRLDIDPGIEQLTSDDRRYEISKFEGYRDLVLGSLQRAGLADTKFRGWRCSVTYPIPFAEMVWTLDAPAE